MARFTTRIQLNGEPDRSTYERLHASMRKKGFTQTVTADDGVEFELPHGEYSFDGDLSLQQVMSAARQASEVVWPDVYVLVTESAGRTWVLKKIKLAKV